MELFYTSNIDGNQAVLDAIESTHCMKVLRHRVGDTVSVMDGKGTLLRCRIAEYRKDGTLLEIMGREENFGAHNYDLEMAVAPTKNIERYEWFLEKATEIGIDTVVPVICSRSERKSIKADRCGKLLLSAAKQSLKGRIPLLRECCRVEDYIRECDKDRIRLIAYCGSVEGAEKSSLRQVLESCSGGNGKISIMIGPEGDFSSQEAELAFKCGFRIIHLGKSRLRTETAAVVACGSVNNMLG